MAFISPFPVRGVAKGGADRLLTVSQVLGGEPGWTSNCSTVASSAPVASGKTRVLTLGIGESGMVGYGSLADAMPTGYPPTPAGNLWTYDVTRGWLPLVEPAHGPQSPMTVKVGAVGMFCAKLLALLGPAYEVAFVPCGYGGSTSVDWAVGGTLYNNAKASALGALTQAGTVLGAIAMEQGINDCGQSITGWSAHWSAIETQLRTDLGGATCPLYYVRQHATVPGAIDSSAWSSLLADQDSWASTNRIKIAKPDGPWVDAQTHLSTSAQTVLSQSYLDAWIAHPGKTS